jgi:hypothetical protein
MSPLRIESRYFQADGVSVIEIKEKAEGFPVGPAEAGKILGLPRTTLFRYDGPDVTRESVMRGNKTDDVRVYSDEALLRIAIETGRADIRPDLKGGLTVLSTEESVALVNIEWSQAQDAMGEHPKRYEYQGKNPEEIEEVAQVLQEQTGIIFRRLPENIYPEMPYVTPDDLVDSGTTHYSVSQLSLIVRSGEIPSVRIDRKVLLTPLSVKGILERQKASELGRLDLSGKRQGGGRRPGSKVEHQPRRKNPWPIEKK